MGKGGASRTLCRAKSSATAMGASCPHGMGGKHLLLVGQREQDPSLRTAGSHFPAVSWDAFALLKSPPWWEPAPAAPAQPQGRRQEADIHPSCIPASILHPHGPRPASLLPAQDAESQPLLSKLLVEHPCCSSVNRPLPSCHPQDSHRLLALASASGAPGPFISLNAHT